MIHHSAISIQEIILRPSVKETNKYMRHRYITKQMLLAFRVTQKKDIHELLAETIAERKQILKRWEQSLFGIPSIDIHMLIAETIAERKRILPHWEKLFFPGQDNNYLMENKKAA